MPDVSDEGLVIAPAPLINVQVPVPVKAVFPARVGVVPQTVWLGPALAMVGGVTPVMVT